MSFAKTSNIQNILEIYKTHTPALHAIITKTISKKKGRWEEKAFAVITHPDLIENNQYLSDECIAKLEKHYKQLRR